jgi:hypothetical protein
MADDTISIDIEIKGDDLMKVLNRLQDGMENKDLILGTIGKSVAQWSRARIQSGANRAPDGSVWPALKPSTIKQKQKKGLGIRESYNATLT